MTPCKAGLKRWMAQLGKKQNIFDESQRVICFGWILLNRLVNPNGSVYANKVNKYILFISIYIYPFLSSLVFPVIVGDQFSEKKIRFESKMV